MMMPRYGKQALFWFCAALVLRLVAAMSLYCFSDATGFGGFFPLESGSDDTQYYHYAKIIGEGRGDTLEWYPTSYPLFLGTIYQITGTNLLLGILINVFAGAACVAVAILLCGAFEDRSGVALNSFNHPAHLTGLLLTLYPSAVLYSCVLTRDSLLLLSGLIAAFSVVRLMHTARVRWLIPMLPASVVFFDLRSYAFTSAAGGIVIFVLSQGVIGKAFRRPVIALVAAILVVFMVQSSIGRYRGYFNQDALEAIRASYSGGSSVDLALDYSSPAGFVISHLINTLYIIISPVLWQVSKPIHVIGLLESVPSLLILPLWLYDAVVAFRRRSASALLLMMAAAQFLAFGLLSNNAGSNARMRLLPFALLIVYFALHAQRWRAYATRFHWNSAPIQRA